jgi:hypothetical protein
MSKAPNIYITIIIMFIKIHSMKTFNSGTIASDEYQSFKRQSLAFR